MQVDGQKGPPKIRGPLTYPSGNPTFAYAKAKASQIGVKGLQNGRVGSRSVRLQKLLSKTERLKGVAMQLRPPKRPIRTWPSGYSNLNESSRIIQAASANCCQFERKTLQSQYNEVIQRLKDRPVRNMKFADACGQSLQGDCHFHASQRRTEAIMDTMSE